MGHPLHKPDCHCPACAAHPADCKCARCERARAGPATGPNPQMRIRVSEKGREFLAKRGGQDYVRQLLDELAENPKLAGQVDRALKRAG